MKKKSMVRKIYAVGIILFFGTIAICPNIQAVLSGVSSNNPVTCTQNQDHLFIGNVTRHLVCFLEKGDVQLCNFQGRFFGIPVTSASGVRHLGVGSFQLDLLYWNESTSASLKVTQFHRSADYFNDVQITVRFFVGWYQPTGGVSGGELRGFAIGLKVTPIV